MKTDCEKFPFDYNKHIAIKSILSPYFKSFVKVENMFQGLTVKRCSKCMVEGYLNLSLPFFIPKITQEETQCTLLRMGLKEYPATEVELMPKIYPEAEEFYCEACEDEFIQDEINKIEDIDISLDEFEN